MSGTSSRTDKTRTDLLEATDSAGQHVYVIWENGSARRSLESAAPVVIGRGNECDIQVVHPSLSRKHVAVHGGTPPRVEDLGSTNGVKIGSRRLKPRASEALLPGEVATAGPVVIVVHDQARAEATASGTAPQSMKDVRQVLSLIGKSAISVLLLGETGVGKEVAADLVRASSPRAQRPMLRLNCAGFTESLLEAELFGYERGAFTGAVRAKPGLLESAEGGTVFLDEVAEMPVTTQVKLLRVLESREVRRIGGLEARTLDVRFVAATHRDLRQLAASGAFRQDLFYRLNGMTVFIPPLRERRDEIPGLVSEFIAGACRAGGRAPLAIEPEALRLLQQHGWPGNIRELRNVVERAVALCTTTVLAREQIVLDDGPSPPQGAPSSDLRADVNEYEKARILEALDRAGGNQTKAAQLIGITRRALIGRLEAHNLPRPRKK
jgi:two-component system response regulator AtoC